MEKAGKHIWFGWEFSWIELGHATALAFAALYGYGFLVVTSYLSTYGLLEYDAFRLQYLVAGMLALGVILLFLYFISDLSDLERRIEGGTSRLVELGASQRFASFWANAVWLGIALNRPLF